MESKSILIEKISHKKLKQIALDNEISMKKIIECLIDNFSDDAISLLTTSTNKTKIDIF